jgi:hypothetical protein
MVDLRAAGDSGHSVCQQRLFGDRRALDTNDDGEPPIVAASGLFSRIRVNMLISA